jgi:hypothetical protein
MIQYTLNFHIDYKLLKIIFEIHKPLHLFLQIYSNLSLYEMKWNNFFSNILFRLYIFKICKNIAKFFQKFEVKYIQTCTPFQSSTMWHSKGGHYNVFSPWFSFLMISIFQTISFHFFFYLCLHFASHVFYFKYWWIHFFATLKFIKVITTMSVI